MIDFLLKLALGSGMIVLNLGIQVWAVYRVIIFFKNRQHQQRPYGLRTGGLRVLSIIMAILFVGHILQFASWAVLFMLLGEFNDFATAFYHSTVNFTSLGYGDIVMSEAWRLLGALEAANGVMMFGLTAGLVLSVMNDLLKSHTDLGEFLQSRDSSDNAR